MRPATFLPLLPTPFPPEDPPNLPARSDAAGPFHDIIPALDWSLSQHICPAAWPRSRNRGAQARSRPFKRKHAALGQDKAKLYEDWAIVRDSVHAPFIDINDRSQFEDQEQLWLALNRYRPAKSRNGKTLIVLQGTGFNKETAEPMVAHLVASSAGRHVAEVWSLDWPSHGVASVLNTGKLGDATYADLGRDLLNFIIRYLPPLNSSAPHMLVEQSVSDKSILDLDWRTPFAKSPRVHSDWRGHQLIGVGHSMGGNAIIYALQTLPLFDGMVVIDPMVIPSVSTSPPPWQTPYRPPVGPSLLRTDAWKDKNAARERLTRPKAVASRWDSFVLDRYLKFGLGLRPDGSLGTLTTKQDEALFLSDEAGQLTFASDYLSSIGNNIATNRIHWIRPRVGGSWIPEEEQEKHIALLSGATSERVDTGHLATLENPEAIAQSLGRFLERLCPARSNL